ncbi:MAG: prepilin-type N-terminal cleavage/methylation domain-containing protein [Verrucomicrobia bacterium]|jgi:type II secretion system protein J|nr:prepilin-type N-terminal cleavage/methylation domain-containing protein [Verrucomicrobiota bacterium]
MKGRRRIALGGFTLVEVVIAIGIFSLVVAAIYTCWSAVLRSSKVGLDAAARAQRSRMAMQCIEEALTYAKMHAANADLYWFEGESGSDARLSFVSKLPRSYPRGGKFGDLTLRRVEFSLQPGEGDDLQLVLRQAPLLMEFDVDEQNHPLVLAGNVEKMIVQFWDLNDEDWVDEWTETNQVPPVVRVSLYTRRGTGFKATTEESTLLVSPAASAVQALSQAGAPPPAPPGQPGQPGQPGPVGAGSPAPGGGARLPIIRR